MLVEERKEWILETLKDGNHVIGVMDLVNELIRDVEDWQEAMIILDEEIDDIYIEYELHNKNKLL